ncbi:MAG: DUF4440 domain-containing protein [Gemmatimonadales bacterium]|nr:DUF4440 domain-containing protein [Gemmatimonadales bacterium]
MLACVPLLFSSLPAQDHPSVVLPPALDRVLREYERGWRTGAADSVAALFAVDGFALPSGRAAARGRAAIASTYAGSGGDLHLRALSWGASDSVGYVVGAYRYAPTGPDVGKFVLALCRDSAGRWLIDADIDNANAPPRMESPGSSPGP